MKKVFLRAAACLTLALLTITAVSFCGPVKNGGFCLTAKAADFREYVTYEIVDDEVTITECDTSARGSLAIPATIEGYPVTCISDEAFWLCRDLESITIPSNVTSIGIDAFRMCSSLTSITIPSSVTSIGYAAFWGCSSLTSITVDEPNDSYSSQDGVLFNKAKTELIQYPIGNKRKAYAIPNSVTSIGDEAFFDCTSLTSIIIPNSVTNINSFAFSECSSLTSITISSSLTSMGVCAFAGCTSLTSITIPNSVTSIGHGAFSGCSSLASITVDEPNDSYSSQGGVLFDKDKTELIQYPIGNQRKEYAIPNSVTSIGDAAFSECTSLTSITIPNSVTSIGNQAFWLCSSLTNITIPRSVTSIGKEWAFGRCTSLTSITVAKDNNRYSSQDGVLFNKAKTELIQYPIGNKRKAYTISNSVTSIGDEAFFDCTSLTNITIPSSVTSIGDAALGWYYTSNDEMEIVPGFSIYGFSGTAAERYAQENEIKFVKLTAVSKCKFTLAASVTYTGKALKPAVTVKNGKTTLKAGTHYTVAYTNNTKIGKATVTIKGVEKNGYSGTKTLAFSILPANVKGLKATQKTSSIKLTWSPAKGAAGYVVFRYNTKTKKWVKIASTKNKSYTVSKLKAGTSYKFAVKAYAKSGKTTYYSVSYAQLTTATKPGTPSLKVTAAKKSAKLSWNKVTGASGYVVYMATSKNGKFKKLATVKGNRYTARKLPKGKTRYFKVMAYKTVGKTKLNSALSAAKKVKAK